MTPNTPPRLPSGAAVGRSRPAAAGRLAAEDGFVMIVVMAMLFIGLALGAVAVAESLHSHNITSLDQRTRRAQQAADGGIQTQLYQQGEQNIVNTLSLSGGPLNLSTMLDCLVPAYNAGTGQLTGGLVSASINSAGVCPGSASGGTPQSTIPVQALGNHAYDQSEFIPGAASTSGGTLYPKILSLGWDDNGGSGQTVYSRQLAILAPIAPLRTLEAQGNLTINGLSLLGIPLASVVYGNVIAGQDLTTPASLTVGNLDNLAGGILGTVTYGGAYHGVLTVPAPVHTSQPVIRQPVSLASTKASCPDAANACSGITVSGGSVGGYHATTNTFTLTSGSATFAAGDYVLCSFDAEGGTVYTSPTAATPVRIFIDSPTSARCNSSTTNAALNQYNDKADANRGNFIAKNGLNNGLSGIAASSSLQIYVVGDQNASNPYDNATTVTLGASATVSLLSISPVIQDFILYAPTSSVTMNTGVCILTLCTGGTFEGALIGDNVSASAAVFTENLSIGSYPLYNGVEVFHPLQFVQCSSQPYKTVAGTTTTYTRLQADPAIDTNGC